MFILRRRRAMGVVRQVDESLSEAGGGGLRRSARLQCRFLGVRRRGRTRARRVVGAGQPGPAGGMRLLTRDRVDGTRGRVHGTERRIVAVRARRQGFSPEGPPAGGSRAPGTVLSNFRPTPRRRGPGKVADDGVEWRNIGRKALKLVSTSVAGLVKVERLCVPVRSVCCEERGPGGDSWLLLRAVETRQRGPRVHARRRLGRASDCAQAYTVSVYKRR